MDSQHRSVRCHMHPTRTCHAPGTHAATVDRRQAYHRSRTTARLESIDCAAPSRHRARSVSTVRHTTPAHSRTSSNSPRKNRLAVSVAVSVFSSCGVTSLRVMLHTMVMHVRSHAQPLHPRSRRASVRTPGAASGGYGSAWPLVRLFPPHLSDCPTHYNGYRSVQPCDMAVPLVRLCTYSR